jgi:excisionase family DNA binding protein
VAVEQLYSVEEVAAQLRVSKNTVYRLLRTGELEGLRVGHLWRVRPAAVFEYLRRGSK